MNQPTCWVNTHSLTHRGGGCFCSRFLCASRMFIFALAFCWQSMLTHAPVNTHAHTFAQRSRAKRSCVENKYWYENGTTHADARTQTHACNEHKQPFLTCNPSAAQKMHPIAAEVELKRKKSRCERSVFQRWESQLNRQKIEWNRSVCYGCDGRFA